MTQQNETTAAEQDEKTSFNVLDWIKSRPAIYDVEATFHEKIDPLMSQVAEICEEEGVPMFAHFEVSVKDGEEARATKACNYFNAGGDIGRMSKLLMAHLLVSDSDWQELAKMGKHAAVREMVHSKGAVKLELTDEDKAVIKQALSVVLKNLSKDNQHEHQH
ncbi:MAG: hypothetical protein ACRC9H_15190 [Aeromonas veronii]